MLMIPISSNSLTYDLFIIIDKEADDRMRDGDPFMADLSEMPNGFNKKKLRNMVIVHKTEKIAKAMEETLKTNTPGIVIEAIMSGVRKLTTDSEYEGPYSLLTPKNKRN